MKKRLAILLVFSCLVLVSFSIQAAQIKVDINQREVDREYSSGLEDMYFAFKGNGGPMFALLNLNFTELNSELEAAGFKPLSDQILLVGGGGLGGFTEGSRFGGYGLKGSVSSFNSNGKKAIYTINYGGFLYEYGVYNNQKLDIALGSLIGGGIEKIDLIYGQVNDFPDAPQRNIYEKTFFALEPRVNLHYQLATFMGFDLFAGYLFTYNQDGSWKANEGVGVDVPLENVSSAVFGLRISFGF